MSRACSSSSSSSLLLLSWIVDGSTSNDNSIRHNSYISKKSLAIQAELESIRQVRRRRCQNGNDKDDNDDNDTDNDTSYRLQLVNMQQLYFSSSMQKNEQNQKQQQSQSQSQQEHIIKEAEDNNDSLSSLAKEFCWSQVTWMDCEGSVEFMCQFRHAKTLTLYRVAPPPTCLLEMDNIIEDDGQEESESNACTNKDNDCESSSSVLHKYQQQLPNDFKNYSSATTTIQVLNLEHCVLDIVASKYLANFLSNNDGTSFKNLMAISFKSCFWWAQEECMDHLARGFAGRRRNNKSSSSSSLLQRVSFHWSNVLDHQLARLIASLPPTVTSLDLAGNICRAEGIMALSNHWLRTSKQQSNKKTLLRLREQCVDVGSKLDIGPLFSTPTLYLSLIHLDVSVNRLTDDDMVVLSDAAAAAAVRTVDGEDESSSTNIPILPSLQILDVRSNNISDRGVEALCRIPSLRQLWLQDNEAITQVGAEHLAQAAKMHANLEYVGLSERFDSSVSRELEHFTTLNWGGRRLLVGRHGRVAAVPLGIWPLVLERASKQDGMDRAANILFYLLRRGPMLWAG